MFRPGRRGILGPRPRTPDRGIARPDPARPRPALMKRRAVGSSAAPDSHGFGDQSSQHTADAPWRLREPGAGGAPRGERAATQIAPARNGHWPRSGRQAVRLEYDHQPDAPAATCVAPCAFAAVRDVTGRLLLVRRCDTGDWELPGGHVDPGESASDAAVRETAEESGVTVEVTGLVASTPTPATSSPTGGPGWCASRSRCASMPARCAAAQAVTRPRPATPGGSLSVTSPPCPSARPCACGSPTRSPPAAHVTSADTGPPRCRRGPGACMSGRYSSSAAPDPGRWIREVRGVPAWSGVSVASHAASRC
jgi:8-oxo-dGTP pyrophosphatase MutT (NUDIX family)